MKWKKLRWLFVSREVVTQVPRSVSASAETLELNRRLAEMATRPIPVVTR